MRLLILNLALILLFTTAYANGIGDTVKGVLGKLGIIDVMKDVKEGLRHRRMKFREALHKTKGKWAELSDELFDSAADELQVDVRDEKERTRKKGHFRRNLAKAEERTKRSKYAMFGITKFSFMELDEFKNKHMMRPMKLDQLSVGNHTRRGRTRSKRSNVSVDLRKKGAVSAIRDQKDCGGCWSFATASTMETSHFKKTGRLVDIAEQQLINCDRQDYGCNGGWMATAYTYAKSNGLPLETSNPYTARSASCSIASGTTVKVLNYTQLAPKDPFSMMDAIDDGYSLAIAMKSGTYDFMYYNGGILDDADDCDDNTVDHALVIVGYGTEDGVPYWIVRNTWGITWGESGYVRIKRGINYCNMEMFPFFVDTN